MLGRIAVTRLEPGDSFDAISAALAAWEPRLELGLGLAQPRVYEPDGTLYAIVLSPESTLSTDRRRVRVARGDLLVVPQGVALDADPEVDLLRIYHDGTPPHHFRERFIQIWGFEHIPAGGAPDAPEVQHRISYAALDASSVRLDVLGSEYAAILLIPLEEKLTIRPGGGSTETLGPGKLAWIGPGSDDRPVLGGAGRVVRIGLRTEWDHRARIAEAGHASPEFRPPGAGEGGRAGSTC